MASLASKRCVRTGETEDGVCVSEIIRPSPPPGKLGGELKILAVVLGMAAGAVARFFLEQCEVKTVLFFKLSLNFFVAFEAA